MSRKTLQPVMNIVKSVTSELSAGELISDRITSPYYISDNHSIGEISDIFLEDPALQALGIVDDYGILRGIITRDDLFSLIGQKFGREIYINRNVSGIIRDVNRIYYRRSTFSVIDEISEDLNSTEKKFYTLVDAENRFRGIFSSFDMVLYLSGLMRREHKDAKRVHSAIVRESIGISDGNLSIYGITGMAGETGGDFIFVKNTGSGRYFISLCDVSGKGLNAALISVAVTSMYSAYDFSRGIPELLKMINAYIFSLFGGEKFLTGIFIDIDSRTGESEIFDMGHSMVYRLNEKGVFRFRDDHQNYPLGITAEIEPGKISHIMKSGETLISYSDGIPEQTGLNNSLFGENRALAIALKYRTLNPERTSGILFTEVKAWSSGYAQSDDMSLLLLKFI